MLNIPQYNKLMNLIPFQSSQVYFAVFSNRSSEHLAGSRQEMVLFNFTRVNFGVKIHANSLEQPSSSKYQELKLMERKKAKHRLV